MEILGKLEFPMLLLKLKYISFWPYVSQSSPKYPEVKNNRKIIKQISTVSRIIPSVSEFNILIKSIIEKFINLYDYYS
jgi:hypothetical protein